MYAELLQSNVMLTNSTGIHGPVVAEHAMAVLLALAKRLPQAMQYQAKHQWSQDSSGTASLARVKLLTPPFSSWAWRNRA